MCPHSVLSRAVVDLQGFTTAANNFLPKEVAILLNGNKIGHWIFSQPFPQKVLNNVEIKRCNWLTKNHHGLCWEDGYIPYYLAATLLKKFLDDIDYVIVKGQHKKEYLNDIGIEAYNIECGTDLYMDWGNALPLHKMPPANKCLFHNGVCALENVFKINNWIIKYYENKL